MQKVAIGFGTALFLMGIAFYVFAPPALRHWTAFIPSALGLIIGICGMLAQNQVRRKMAMHIAAGVALLGTLGSLPGLFSLPKFLLGQTVTRPLAVVAQSLTAILCSVFLILCVRSFIDARRNIQSL